MIPSSFPPAPTSAPLHYNTTRVGQERPLQRLPGRLHPERAAKRPVQPTIYIPNFNGAERLGGVLRALGEQTAPCGVVLVDNGSGDDSIALARRELPDVRVVELGENLGFGRAINRGVAALTGDP